MKNDKKKLTLAITAGVLGLLIIILLIIAICRLLSSNAALKQMTAQQSESTVSSSENTPESLLSSAEPSSEEPSSEKEAASQEDSASQKETANQEETASQAEAASQEETTSQEATSSPKETDSQKDANASGKKDSQKKKPSSEQSTADTTADKNKPDTEKPVPATPTSATLSSDAAVPSVCGALSVNGTQLTDQNGNPVQLRGISTHGLAWFPDYVNADAFRQFRQQWNVNVMRLAMYTHEYGGYCSGGDKEKLKKLVKQGVQYATDNDMYVIIDWHVLQDQNPNTYKEDAKTFFDEMSKLYKNQNNVIYEICNEPNGGVSWSEIKSYAEEIIPVIRANDETAVILVGTPNWSQRVDEAAKDPITGYSNIMYTLHFYAATHKDSLRSTMINAVKAGLPIFVSEYGICDASGNGSLDKDSAGKWVDAMNQYGISYVCWSLANKAESASLLLSSCSKTSNFSDSDLSESGKWLYQTLTGQTSLVSGNTAAGTPGSTNANNTNNNAPDNTNTNNPGNSNADNTNNSSSSNTGNSETNNSGNPGADNNDTSAGNTPPAASVHSENLLVDAVLVSSWESDGAVCYQYNFTLTNTSDQAVDSWAVHIAFNDTIALSSGWCGTYTADGNTLHISCEDYNGHVDAGGTIKDLGCILSSSQGLTIVP